LKQKTDVTSTTTKQMEFFRFLEAKRSIMSLTSRWMSRWVFIRAEPVRRCSPTEFLTYVFNCRGVEKDCSYDATVTEYVTKALKSQYAVDQSPQLFPRVLHTDYLFVSTGGRPTHFWKRISVLQLPRYLHWGKFVEISIKISRTSSSKLWQVGFNKHRCSSFSFGDHQIGLL